MEKYNCFKCGKEMDFCGYSVVDTNAKDRTIWIEEKWECFTCGKKEKIEITGKITDLCRNA